MRAKRRPFSAVAMKATAVEAESPASFQPSKAHTIAGALRPSGRRSQMKGCIRTTVHHGRMSPLGNTTQIDEGQIATLRFEQEVDGVFACVRKERQMSRAGTPYLTIALRDSTGTIRGGAFRDADVLAARFEQGELVRVHGRVERFRDELQIALGTIARADGIDADPARILPTAYRYLDQLDGLLEHL